MICALSLRQAFATVELTGTNNSSIQAWMKEISSNGNLNTVDVIYPAMPVFLYLAPHYLGWLIEPILQYQTEGASYESCAHDLGMHYPYATGPSDGANSHMPVEESGNILIIALAHAQATANNSLLTKYYRLFVKWTNYLMEKALIPEEQLTTDGMDCTLRRRGTSLTHLNRLHGPHHQLVIISFERRHRYLCYGRHRGSNRSRRRTVQKNRKQIHHSLAKARYVKGIAEEPETSAFELLP